MKWTPEELAKKFHELYESLAPNHGYETRKESAVAWEDVLEKNKTLMIDVCKHIIDESTPPPVQDLEKWIGGEAEKYELQNGGTYVSRNAFRAGANLLLPILASRDEEIERLKRENEYLIQGKIGVAASLDIQQLNQTIEDQKKMIEERDKSILLLMDEVV